jgi:hypothetical protein
MYKVSSPNLAFEFFERFWRTLAAKHQGINVAIREDCHPHLLGIVQKVPSILTILAPHTSYVLASKGVLP